MPDGADAVGRAVTGGCDMGSAARSARAAWNAGLGWPDRHGIGHRRVRAGLVGPARRPARGEGSAAGAPVSAGRARQEGRDATRNGGAIREMEDGAVSPQRAWGLRTGASRRSRAWASRCECGRWWRDRDGGRTSFAAHVRCRRQSVARSSPPLLVLRSDATVTKTLFRTSLSVATIFIPGRWLDLPECVIFERMFVVSLCERVPIFTAVEVHPVLSA